MAAAATISVYLVDDEGVIRAALRALLEQSGRIAVVGDSSSAVAAIEAVRAAPPDVVLMDIEMPGLSGIDAVPVLKAAAPGTRVVMASHHEDARHVLAALDSGADGYLSKGSDPDDLVAAIVAVHAGDSYLAPRVASAVVGAMRRGETRRGSPLSCLTPREQEVFGLVAGGRTNKEIATALGLEVGTVKKHRENLQRKLDCHSPAAIARLAIREGLLRP